MLTRLNKTYKIKIGTINFKAFTFGKIVQTINKIGLSICTDLKLKSQLRRQNSNNKKELGDFCYQFGYDPIITPSHSKTKQKTFRKYKNHNNNYNTSYYPPKSKPHNKFRK